MAHHLPRKKYLSKLIADSPEEKCCQTSTPSNKTLASNESRESLLTAIVNSTTLGISEFDSAVFRVSSNGSCTGDLPSSSACDGTKDRTNCREVCNPSLNRVTDDDVKTCESRNSSPVYFDDGSMDDEDEDETVKSGVDVASVDAVLSPDATNAKMLQQQTSSCVAPSPSLSNLIDDSVLNNLLPSAESFANLLNSLEFRERTLSASSHQRSSADRVEQPFSHAAADQLGSSQASSAPNPLTSQVISVKQEQIDMDFEAYDAEMESAEKRTAKESLTTTSGRNRGRGKALEPRYECQICGDVAAGYHCGAYVCEACKVPVLPFSLFKALSSVLLIMYACVRLKFVVKMPDYCSLEMSLDKSLIYVLSPDSHWIKKVRDCACIRPIMRGRCCACFKFSLPPSILGCWPSGVELPATGGYVPTVSGDLLHSTQDVPIYLIIS